MFRPRHFWPGSKGCGAGILRQFLSNPAAKSKAGSSAHELQLALLYSGAVCSVK